MNSENTYNTPNVTDNLLPSGRKGGSLRVNEIFYSLQGEGRYTGTPAVFVRLSGCNEKCPFCDTQHLSYNEMTEAEIVESVCAFGAHHVVITGGEPALQMTTSLAERLHERGLFIQMETNGSVKLPEDCHIDWVTCSPKSLPVILQKVDEVKVLFPFMDGMDAFISDVLPELKSRNSGRLEMRLQPLDTGNDAKNAKIIKDTIDYILENPEWSLSLQTHKMLEIQ